MTTSTTIIEAPKPPPLYPKQRAAIDDPARIVCIDASTKSGKTAGCLSWAYRKRISKRNSKGIWIEPTYTMARDIGYSRLVKMMTRADPDKRIWDCADSRLEVTFANGSMQRFKGGDDPDGIYGEDYDDAVIDEASRCKEGVWSAVRSTLTATRGPVRIIGNVKGRKNWAWRLGQMAKAGERDMAYHKLTAYDAVDGGVMASQELEDAKRQLPEIVFRELYLAEPTDDGANPFGIPAIRRCTKPMSDGPAVAFGVDLAKRQDWLVVVGLDASGCCCTLDRWQADWGQSRRRIAQIIGRTPAVVDSTGVGDPIVEDLQRDGCVVEGYQFTGGAGGKQKLMESLAADIQQENISFPHGWLTDELESFEFEYTKHGVRYSAPEGLHDDGVCALALAAKCLRGAAVEDFAFEWVDL